MINESIYLSETQKQLAEQQRENEPYTVDVSGKSFLVYPGVFSPKYFRSPFMQDDVPIIPSSYVLEIGCGVGVFTVFAANQDCMVTAVDLNPDAVLNTQENVGRYGLEERVTVFCSDVYQNVSGKFDLIFWNVPFFNSGTNGMSLVERAICDPAYGAIDRFISEGPEYLSATGRLLLEFSDTMGDWDGLQKIVSSAKASVSVLKETTLEYGAMGLVNLQLLEVVYK